MSSNLLYLATRSPRAGAPAFSWPQPLPTARSAMKESSVSPERWETNCRYPAARQGLGNGTDLVELDQRGVADPAGDGPRDDGRISGP